MSKRLFWFALTPEQYILNISRISLQRHRERERERERNKEKEREREGLCVCVCVRERERRTESVCFIFQVSSCVLCWEFFLYYLHAFCIQVNGESVIGMAHNKAVAVIKRAKGPVSIAVSRPPPSRPTSAKKPQHNTQQVTHILILHKELCSIRFCALIAKSIEISICQYFSSYCDSIEFALRIFLSSIFLVRIVGNLWP